MDTQDTTLSSKVGLEIAVLLRSLNPSCGETFQPHLNCLLKWEEQRHSGLVTEDRGADIWAVLESCDDFSVNLGYIYMIAG